jgi:hypothetical protein
MTEVVDHDEAEGANPPTSLIQSAGGLRRARRGPTPRQRYFWKVARFLSRYPRRAFPILRAGVRDVSGTKRYLCLETEQIDVWWMGCLVKIAAKVLPPHGFSVGPSGEVQFDGRFGSAAWDHYDRSGDAGRCLHVMVPSAVREQSNPLLGSSVPLDETTRQAHHPPTCIFSA